MHKSPIKVTFITAALQCSLKPHLKGVTAILKTKLSQNDFFLKSKFQAIKALSAQKTNQIQEMKFFQVVSFIFLIFMRSSHFIN